MYRKIKRNVKKYDKQEITQNNTKIITFRYPDLCVRITYDEWNRIIDVHQKIGNSASRFPKFYYIHNLKYEYNSQGLLSSSSYLSKSSKESYSSKTVTKYIYDCHNELIQKKILTYENNILSDEKIIDYINSYNQNKELETRYVIKPDSQILRVKCNLESKMRTIWNNNASLIYSVLYSDSKMDYYLIDNTYTFSLFLKKHENGIQTIEFLNPAGGTYFWYLFWSSIDLDLNDTINIHISEPVFTSEVFLEIVNFIVKKYPKVSLIYLSMHHSYTSFVEAKKMNSIASKYGLEFRFLI